MTEIRGKGHPLVGVVVFEKHAIDMDGAREVLENISNKKEKNYNLQTLVAAFQKPLFELSNSSAPYAYLVEGNEDAGIFAFVDPAQGGAFTKFDLGPHDSRQKLSTRPNSDAQTEAKRLLVRMNAL
ncbi:MAG: hypothetical protein K9G62_08910 [Alphaproteobacteria bacterium]|nr:hypothetical protein [Alphaproteobacteria bacterium]